MLYYFHFFIHNYFTIISLYYPTADLAVLAASLLGIVPSILCERGNPPNLEEIIEMYKDDLPSPELVSQELLRFKIK